MRTNEYTFDLVTDAGTFEWVVDAYSLEQAKKLVVSDMKDADITIRTMTHKPYQGMPMTMADLDKMI